MVIPFTSVANIESEVERVEHKPFVLKADYEPAGDQPQAIAKLVEGINDGFRHQTLLGVTGSGKTHSVSRVIEKVQRPALSDGA